MGKVSARLQEIINSLQIIDKKFHKSKTAEEKLNFRINEDMSLLERQANRIESNANELIVACADYLTLVRRDIKQDPEQLTWGQKWEMYENL